MTSQEATASLVLPLVLWVATLVAIVLVDAGAYFTAAARAQNAGDAAALAAIGTGGLEAADRVAAAGGARLERCTCGRTRASVEVSVAVEGLVIPAVGAGRVRATAEAELVYSDVHEW